MSRGGGGSFQDAVNEALVQSRNAPRQPHGDTRSQYRSPTQSTEKYRNDDPFSIVRDSSAVSMARDTALQRIFKVMANPERVQFDKAQKIPVGAKLPSRRVKKGARGGSQEYGAQMGGYSQQHNNMSTHGDGQVKQIAFDRGQNQAGGNQNPRTVQFAADDFENGRHDSRYDFEHNIDTQQLNTHSDVRASAGAYVSSPRDQIKTDPTYKSSWLASVATQRKSPALNTTLLQQSPSQAHQNRNRTPPISHQQTMHVDDGMNYGVMGSRPGSYQSGGHPYTEEYPNETSFDDYPENFANGAVSPSMQPPHDYTQHSQFQDAAPQQSPRGNSFDNDTTNGYQGGAPYTPSKGQQPEPNGTTAAPNSDRNPVFKTAEEEKRAKQTLFLEIERMKGLGYVFERNFTYADDFEDIHYEIEIKKKNAEAKNAVDGLTDMGKTVCKGLAVVNDMMGTVLHLDGEHQPFADKIDPFFEKHKLDIEALYQKYMAKKGHSNPVMNLIFGVVSLIVGTHFRNSFGDTMTQRKRAAAQSDPDPKRMAAKGVTPETQTTTTAPPVPYYPQSVQQQFMAQQQAQPIFVQQGQAAYNNYPNPAAQVHLPYQDLNIRSPTHAQSVPYQQTQHNYNVPPNHQQNGDWQPAFQQQSPQIIANSSIQRNPQTQMMANMPHPSQTPQQPVNMNSHIISSGPQQGGMHPASISTDMRQYDISNPYGTATAAMFPNAATRPYQPNPIQSGSNFNSSYISATEGPAITSQTLPTANPNLWSTSPPKVQNNRVTFAPVPSQRVQQQGGSNQDANSSYSIGTEQEDDDDQFSAEFV